MNKEFMEFTKNQEELLNEYKAKCLKCIEEVKYIISNDSTLYLYALFSNARISHQIISNNINKARAHLTDLRNCIAIIEDDERERNSVIENYSEESVNTYYKNAYSRNSMLLKFID